MSSVTAGRREMHAEARLRRGNVCIEGLAQQSRDDLRVEKRKVQRHLKRPAN